MKELEGAPDGTDANGLNWTEHLGFSLDTPASHQTYRATAQWQSRKTLNGQ